MTMFGIVYCSYLLRVVDFCVNKSIDFNCVSMLFEIGISVLCSHLLLHKLLEFNEKQN